MADVHRAAGDAKVSTTFVYKHAVTENDGQAGNLSDSATLVRASDSPRNDRPTRAAHRTIQ